MLAILGVVSTAGAAEHWRGAGWGGDGTSWNDLLNWDDAIPSNTSWDANGTGEQGTPSNHDIHITEDDTSGSGTIYNQAGYTVDLTVESGVTMTNSGDLAYHAARTFTVMSGAFYDMRYGQLGLESGPLTVTIGGHLFCSTLRHNNGAMVDVYGLLEAWTVSRISAEGTYRLSVYNGGEFVVYTEVPDTGGWSDGGKVTQYLGSIVTLAGDHTANYTDLVQMGEPGVWDVSVDGGYTQILLRDGPDVCDFTVSPEDVNTLPGESSPSSQQHALTLTNTTPAGGLDVNYSVVEVDRNGAVADIPWLSVDKPTGGPVAAGGGTDVITATVDYTQLQAGVNVARLRFTSTCDPYEVHEVEFIAPFILEYQGNVDPEAANAGGVGLRFTERENDSSDADVYRNMTPIPGLFVEEDSATGDGYSLHVLDGPDKKLKFRTTPSQNIGGTTGATIVARVRCTYKSGTSGENVTVWHDGGGTLGYHWSGWGDAGSGAGYIKETSRSADYTKTGQTQEWYSSYHVIRASMGAVNGERTIRLYLDEDPVPVIEIPNANNVSSPTDSIGFGTGSTAGQQDISFDWVTGTNAGNFGPGEEVACIGRSLVPPTPGACCQADGTCAAVLAADCIGDYKGDGTLCAAIPDTDGDGDLDQVDFAELQRCLTIGAAGVSSGCEPFDLDGDSDVDAFDLESFAHAAGGAGVQAISPTCAAE